jgi:hypothetical protein
MATISGIFNDPFGVPMAGVLIELAARKTTTVSITGTNAAAVTADDGSYSMPVLPGVYAVSAKIGYTPDYLGVIQVYADSPDGTLNQYLAEFNPDDVTPEVLREMQLILMEARLAAESAWLAAETAKQFALIPRGMFDPDVAYQRHDLVEFDGSEYLATADVAGIAPPESPWQLFVAAGADGETGEQGPQGPVGEPGPAGPAGNDGEQGPQGESGEKGDTGEVGPRGEPGPAGPQGEKGDTGDTGPAGADGKQGVQGDAGPQGPKGEDGAPGETGPAGPQGDAGPEGPQGARGADGESAYQIWLDAGNTGTEDDFLDSLKGESGPKGDKGDTGAAGEQGPQGEKGDVGATGPAGAQGAEGEAGPTNTLTIGTVITGEPDDPAAAEITGDAPDQILNLTIPKGQPGEGAAGFPENYNTIEILGSTAISLAPEFSGELSKTYHISQSVEVDLASFGSTASGGNPNAVLRLIIHGHTPDPVITFKNGGYYYTPEGKHASVAPVVDTSLAPTNQELTVIELRYIPTTNTQGYAISVMQAFPNGVTGAWIT